MNTQEIQMASPTTVYRLPCSPTQRCLDRFSVLEDADGLEDDNGHVPVWHLLQHLLDTSPVADGRQLADLLETIAITLRDTTGAATDYGLLKDMVGTVDDKTYGNFFETCWPRIRSLALSMPALFPNGTLPLLGSTVLSRPQVACLLAHQFLCTLSAPLPRRSDYFDFSIWFGSEQRHPEAVRIYLTTLFKYFSKLPDRATHSTEAAQVLEATHVDISYCLTTLSPEPSAAAQHSNILLSPIQIHLVSEYDTSPASLGLPHGAAVVSANRVIGFGESATQEEIHVGCSPEACPAVLIAPELQESQILVVRGAKAVSNIVGQRRGVRLREESFRGPQSGSGNDDVADVDWGSRTMLFMDALELDSPEQYSHPGDVQEQELPGGQIDLPDLVPRNMDREIAKARLAFSSGTYHEIVSPLWGCGAFNGDPFVKVLLLWIAASTAAAAQTGLYIGEEKQSKPAAPALRIVCDQGLRDIADRMSRLVRLAGTQCSTVGELRGLLEAVPKDTKKFETGEWLLAKLSSARIQ
ncbi:hypothetical protein Micbo1qcDRAFT_165738 [Microdochium bolleyi]|uniref:poly(ADP-ribose) glycohydrolase n=1 Tax=Microdochium bolleyi TaxID=196109 RepID=A0A136IXK0_9PEZI|nr:hypothetical protein Micbo1qcDRAFT_165738 [Microdochium bolleyi]